TCIALDLGAISDRPEQVPASWWDAGAAGDCSTRTSDIITTTARLIPGAEGYQIELERALLRGEADVVRMQVVPVGDDLQGSVTSARDTPVRFVRVQEVAPTFAPVP
ncbi:MAG: hypothetical protein M3P18_14525, partial [Actinomycetota bacterium]|nr:hypothetical protein [Actinomycetota bacterium]